VGASGEEEWIGAGLPAGRVGAVAEEFLGVDAVRDDAVAENEEVGGEGKGPCAGYGWEVGVRRTSAQSGKQEAYAAFLGQEPQGRL